jgi:hypothetical protein
MSVMNTDDSQYYISEGVRRAVAARELGLIGILANLQSEGQPDRLICVDLDVLHSPKAVIARFEDHRRNFSSLMRAMSTPEGRSKIPPIEIEPLGVPFQSGSVPLAEVLITGRMEDHHGEYDE